MSCRRRIEADGYAIRYHGGRLADVEVDGSIVDTVQVRAYDWVTGEFTEPEPTDQQLIARVERDAYLLGWPGL